MAVTIAQVNTDPQGSVANKAILGNLRLAAVDVTLDVSYPTGGYTILPPALGFPENVLLAWVEPKSVEAHSAVQFWYDTVTNKLQAFSTTAEIANAADLHLINVRIFALGY